MRRVHLSRKRPFHQVASVLRLDLLQDQVALAPRLRRTLVLQVLDIAGQCVGPAYLVI